MIINPYIFGGFDPDAQAFITAANITNTTQQNAINTLVVSLKGYGVWTKMKAIYPFVGGTASTHKFNLKDPRDLDAAFRLQFFGGVTHTVNGITGNGVNGYGNTSFIPTLNFNSLNDKSFSVYVRTNTNIGIELGTINTGAGFSGDQIVARVSNIFTSYNSNTGVSLVPSSDSKGFWLSNRINSTTSMLYKNNINVLNIGNSNIQSSLQFIILGRNTGVPDQLTDKNIAFAHLGDGLTDTEASNLAITVESFQTTLGRSVNPWYNNGNLLLDDYPNAATAYSVRKLRNYYIGPCLRVRRSSDNAEQDIYFNPSGELDTVSLLSFVGANNGFVTIWYDQSANGRNQTMTTAANQPQIVSSGTVILRGTKPAIRFDGSNDYLLNNTTGLALDNLSHYVVNSRANSVNASRVIYSTGILTAQGRGFGFFYSSSPTQDKLFQQIRNLNLTGLSIGDYANIIDTNNIIFGINTATTDNTYFNGSNLITQPYSKAGLVTNSPITIGTRLDAPPTSNPGLYNNGTVSELVIWQSNQSTNRTAIETNINLYFNIY